MVVLLRYYESGTVRHAMKDRWRQNTDQITTKENRSAKRIEAISALGAIDATAFKNDVRHAENPMKYD
jgi:hypothetical protein